VTVVADMGTVALLVVLAAAITGWGGESAAPPTSPLSPESMTRFLVQAACLDAEGKVIALTPLDPACNRRRPMTEEDPVFWRKHDWGGSDGAATGWQASDSVLARRGGVGFILQTFDFGAPARDNAGWPDAFRRFDANDGGDALIVVGDTASAFITQDGGTPGLQWFVGPGCATPGQARYLSWISFKADAGAEWHSLVAQLATGRADVCPRDFGKAFTRYRLVDAAIPFLRESARENVWLPVVLSEHYEMPSIAESTSLERFYYAYDLGKIRWEAWSTGPDKASQGASLAASGRCPAFPEGAAPGPGWRMVDCRTWTNIVGEPGTWRVREFGWPPPDTMLKP
jgi:hypothetical protein